MLVIAIFSIKKEDNFAGLQMKEAKIILYLFIVLKTVNNHNFRILNGILTNPFGGIGAFLVSL